MSTLVIVGAQWGDEGKGKIVDVLTEYADIVVRFQGGNNAGHTLVVDGSKVKLSIIPSGILWPTVVCYVGAGTVINLEVFFSELASLAKLGIDVSPGRIVVDRGAHLVMPYHVAIDKEREKGPFRIGTTGRGIGPVYEDRAARCGIRVADLMAPNVLKPRLERIIAEKNLYLKHVLCATEMVDGTKAYQDLVEFSPRLFPYSGDVGELVSDGVERGRRVVFEGAQGSMLDVTHGSVPFVTSSNTLAAAAALGTGIGPKLLGHVLGVTKAYATRVGEGPFPTELLDAVGDRLRSVGGEYGTVTGRPRRCGWLDLVALKRAIRLNGIDSLALTKIDVLSGLEKIKVCVGYQSGEVDTVVPQYLELEGWEDDLGGVRNLAALPQPVQRFCSVVSDYTKCPISIVSVSPERRDTIFLGDRLDWK